ncbi:MAG: hypothetical protein E7I55_10220 [Acinetobacter ursingii]|nr:hypothetical protein [Acinetobacter ursingii]
MKNKILRLSKDSRIINSVWMILEKGTALFGLLFVISAMAKYIGTELYGYIALSTSIFVLVKSISQLGLDQVYFKYVSKKNNHNDLVLKSTIYLISFIYLLISAIVFFIFYERLKGVEWGLFISVAFANFILAIDIRAIHLDAILQSKFNVLANLVGLVVSLSIRFFIVKYKFDPVYFSVPIVLVTLLPFLIRVYVFKIKKNVRKIKMDKKSFLKFSKYYFKVGLPLMVSILSVNIYTQSANLYMGYKGLIGDVGIYSVATLLAGCWCFVPTTLIMSFLPKIYQMKDSLSYIQQAGVVLRGLIVVNFCIIFFLWFVVEWFVNTMYGPNFLRAVFPFKILLISSFFSIIGFFFYRMTMKYSGYSFLAKKMTLTCFFNIVFMFFLVNKFGMIGAAIASLLTEFFSNILLNLFFRDIRMIQVFKYALIGR